MAVETKGTVATDDKEMLISGSEACAEALTLADIDVVTGVPDPALRHRDAGHRQEDRQRPAGRRVHRGRGRAQPVRDRQARLHGGRARVLRLLRRGLDVRDGVPDRDPAAARAHGVHGGQPRPGRPRRLRRRAQRRPRRARPRLDAHLGGHRPGDARHDAPRLSHRRGPAGLPADRDVGGRGLPHPLADHRAGADPGQGGSLPAQVRPGRPPAASRQPDHGRAAGQRGLGHRDPPAEQRGDEPRLHRDRGGLRRLPQACSAAGPRTRGSRST